MAWTRGPTIGRGSTAAVSLATSPSGDIFAVKSADLSSSTLLQKEEHLISQLCSPFIVKCFGSDVTCDEDDKPVFNLFLEYVSGGTLSDRIRKQGNSLEEDVIRYYANQILLGLNYIHVKGLVHGDIKGQNVLIGDDGLKIADFGCAKWAEGGVGVFSGTPAYMAPEVARGEGQGFAADVWAFGCTIIEMATGRHPWPEMKDPASALYRIAFSGEVPECPGWFSGEAKDMLGKCLMKDAKDRWTAAELLEHPFFRSNCGGIGGFTRRSPTSVTDQDFWDALEVSDSSHNPTETASSSSSDSPADRIGALIGGGFTTSWSDPEEGEWLTVRGNETEECSGIWDDNVEDDEFLVAESVIELEEIHTSMLVEDSLLDCLDGDDISTFPDTHSGSVKELLYLELSIFMLLELFFHQDRSPQFISFISLAIIFWWLYVHFPHFLKETATYI